MILLWPRCGLAFPVAMLCMLAGCSGPPPEADTGAGNAAAAASAAAAPPAATGSSGLPGDHASTARYKIAIDYPELAPGADVLMQALHEHAAAAKREFMQALPDPQKFPEIASRQLQLLIDYRVTTRSPAFVSVRGQGMMDTGGAHPMPLDATFVFDAQAQRLVTLDDLFVDPQAARGILADFARGKLEQALLANAPGQDEATPKVREEWMDNMHAMIDAGTQPTAENFAEFQIDADGLRLVFPPYQVAPYVYGAQIVAVPLKVFAAALKPAYRDAFIPAS